MNGKQDMTKPKEDKMVKDIAKELKSIDILNYLISKYNMSPTEALVDMKENDIKLDPKEAKMFKKVIDRYKKDHK
tara:strand:- start:1195 stop:1419 length:225 start_codon:yes stop_codon:yes gene_type:complete